MNNLVEIAKVIVANGVEDWCLSPEALFVTMKDDDIQDRTFKEINTKNLLDGTNLRMTVSMHDIKFSGHLDEMNNLADEIDRQWGG